MLLDERRFEDESFGFCVGDDEFKIRDLIDEFFGLDAVTEFTAPARLKIRAHAIAQALGLADVDDFAFRVLMKIHTG